MVESKEPDTKLPLGNTINLYIPFVCPNKLNFNNPVLGSQIFMVLSEEPEAK